MIILSSLNKMYLLIILWQYVGVVDGWDLIDKK